jgi:hypothetical protein
MRRLLVIWIAVLSTPVFSGAGSAPTPGGLAQQHFNERLVALGQQIDACTRARADLPYGKIKALDLSREALRAALLYHNARADYECAKDAIGEFLAASAALKLLSEQFPGMREGADAGVELAVDVLVRVLQRKPEYLKIDSKTRSSIEAVEELQKPFDPIRAAEKLGL